MTQGALDFKYEEEKNETGITAFGGSLLFLDLLSQIGFTKIVNHCLGAKKGKPGWSDVEFLVSLLLLNVCGGDCVDDIRNLENDSGLRRILKHISLAGAWGRRRLKLKRKWCNSKKQSFPSPSAIFRYLGTFHDDSQEEVRKKLLAKVNAVAGACDKGGQTKEKVVKAFIPQSNAHLSGLCDVNRELVRFLQLNNEQRTATLDMDATLVRTNKKKALFCYKGYKAYQPLNTWWWEQGVVLHTGFRDGNVPAGFEQRRVLEEALACLPAGIETVYVRSDSAGYQHDVMRYCELDQNKRFGRIEFAISCSVVDEFKKEVYQIDNEEWHRIYKKVNGELRATGQEWAEVPFVPNAIAKSKKGPDYRYLAIRELLKPNAGAGSEEQKSFPFPTMQFNGSRYKLTGLVSNMAWEGERLIHWSRKRCGDSEHIHSEMKEEFAGGQLPSGEFGSNAAWWWIMVMSLNLNAIMRSVVLGKSWKKRRMKSVRISVIYIACRVVKQGRDLVVRVAKGHQSLDLLLHARERIVSLKHSAIPSG